MLGMPPDGPGILPILPGLTETGMGACIHYLGRFTIGASVGEGGGLVSVFNSALVESHWSLPLPNLSKSSGR